MVMLNAKDAEQQWIGREEEAKRKEKWKIFLAGEFAESELGRSDTSEHSTLFFSSPSLSILMRQTDEDG